MVLVLFSLPYPHIYIELDTMLPEDGEITRSIRLSEQYFGSSDYVVIGLVNENGQALNSVGIRQLRRVNDALLTLPGVRTEDLTSLVSARAEVVRESASGLSFIPIVGNQYYPETDSQVRALSSSIYKNLLSQDGRASLILLRIEEPAGGKLAFDRRLRELLNNTVDAGFSFVVGGQPTTIAALERYTQNIFLVLPFTLLLIALIHFEAFRSMQGLVFPLITALAAAGFATAVMTRAGIMLDGFNTSAPLLIVALTAGHAVQMLKRYNEELVALAKGLMPNTTEWVAAHRAAIERSFTDISPVMVAASLVAACSFASLVIFETPVVRTFGFYAAVGILAGLVVELLFIPALRLRVVPKALPHMENRLTFWDRIVDGCARLCRPDTRRLTVAVGAVFMALIGAAASKVTVDNSVEEYFARFTETRKTERFLNERFSGSSVLYVVVKGDKPSALATAETANLILDIQQWLLRKPEIGSAVSFVNAAGEVGCGFDPGYCMDGPRPWTDDAFRQLLFIYDSNAAEGALADFVTPERDVAVIRILSRTDSSLYIDQLFRDLRAEFDGRVPPGVELVLGGTGATTLALNQKFIEEKLSNVAQMLGIAALIAGLLFRSVLMGLLVAVPLLAATLFAFAIMTLTGIPLNVATVFIAAIAVGIGADYAIYFGTRLRDFLARHPDDEALAVHRTFRTAGKAALFVASAVGGGYLGLIVSVGYNVHLWLGLLVSAAMLASIVASLTLFPSLLLTLRPKAVFRR